MDVDRYAGPDGLQACFVDCMKLAGEGALDELMVALTVKAVRTYEKHEVPRIAAAALVSSGEEGARRLKDFIHEGEIGGLRASAALRALWLAGTGQSPMVSSLGIFYADVPVDAAVREQARIAVDDFISEAPTSPDRFSLLVAFQSQEMMLAPGLETPPFSAHVLHVLRESSIILTLSLIEEFETLIDSSLPEADYQVFLEENPVLLDPLAAEILNRRKLGLEFITDFVLRRHDSQYVVVEIEKPQDRVFTTANDFTAKFTHASGQVLDFQGWVAENTAYAQRSLPGIESPKGVLIMGRRRDMSRNAEAKLRRWMVNSKNIEVLTFDDLARRARALHTSLRSPA